MNKNQALWLNQNTDRLASLAYEEYFKRGPGTVVVKFNGIDPVLSYAPAAQNKKLAYSYDPHTQMSVMIGCDVLTLPHNLAQTNLAQPNLIPAKLTPPAFPSPKSNYVKMATVPQ